MSAPLRSIAILGGGAAGWLTALYLERRLRQPGGSPVTITLIESEDTGGSGPGESTMPSLRQTLGGLGIAEPEFLVRADATLTQGVKFQDWKSPGTSFLHPFEVPEMSDGVNVAHHWVNMRNRGESIADFGQAVSVQSSLCEAGRSPKLWASGRYDAPVPYAYNLDAARFAQYLRDIASKRGIARIVGTVADVAMTADGFIASLPIAQAGGIAADLFVDCSPSGRLIEQALNDPFQPFAELLCDREITFEIPLPGAAPIRPYTTNTAKSAGWVWEIDLFDRLCTGYVYSSSFISDDDAHRELCRHHGRDPAETNSRTESIRNGRRNNAWVKNCVAIGPAAGDIEPLEWTGLYLVEAALNLLIDHLGYARPAAELADRYSRHMRDAYDGVKDFIAAHYVTSGRRDTQFWRACTEGIKISDTLADNLKLWRHRIALDSDILNQLPFFQSYSYNYILAGMGLMPAATPLDGVLDLARSKAVFAQIAKAQASAVSQHPDHREFIQRNRGAFG